MLHSAHYKPLRSVALAAVLLVPGACDTDSTAENPELVTSPSLGDERGAAEWIDDAWSASSKGDHASAARALRRARLALDRKREAFWARSDAIEKMRWAIEIAYRSHDFSLLGGFAAVLLERHPDDAHAELALGLASRQLGDNSEASARLRRALAGESLTREERELARLQLGIALLKQGSLRAAVSELAVLLDHNPHHRRAYLQLAAALARLGKSRDAEGFVEAAVRLELVDGENRRAGDYESAGLLELAARHRARALAAIGDHVRGEAVLRELSATRTGARVYLVEYLVDAYKVREARVVLGSLAEELGAGHPDVRGWRAAILVREGQTSSAVSALVDLCNRHPAGVEVWGLRLARLLLDELSEPQLANQWLGAVLKTRASREARVFLGRSLVEIGRFREALDMLDSMARQKEAAVEESPALWHAVALCRAGLRLEEAGRSLAFAAPRVRHRAVYFVACAEWFEAGGGAFEGSEGLPESAEEAREEAERIDALEKACRVALIRAARSTESESASFLLAASRLRGSMQDRDGALRLARLAAYHDGENARVSPAIEALLDRPEDLFLRREVRRQRARSGNASATLPTIRGLIEGLVGPAASEDDR